MTKEPFKNPAQIMGRKSCGIDDASSSASKRRKKFTFSGQRIGYRAKRIIHQHHRVRSAGLAKALNEDVVKAFEKKQRDLRPNGTKTLHTIGNQGEDSRIAAVDEQRELPLPKGMLSRGVLSGGMPPAMKDVA